MTDVLVVVALATTVLATPPARLRQHVRERMPIMPRASRRLFPDASGHRMTGLLLTYEPGVRVAFLGVLTAMALWEAAAPRRCREIPRVLRWSNNLAGE